MFTLLEPYRHQLEIWISNKQNKIDVPTWEEEQGVRVYQMKQVHGNSVVCVDPHTAVNTEADAVCTNSLVVALSVRFADCQNFVLFDPVTTTVAVVHAGYKGLVQNVLTNCVRTLQEQYGVDPATLLVCSTASLGKECAQFTNPLVELPGIDPKFFTDRMVDLVGIASDELLRAGVQPEHIALSTECTKCNTGIWYSYRGEEVVKTDNLRNILIVRLRG